jgi:hypothetical protein
MASDHGTVRPPRATSGVTRPTWTSMRTQSFPERRVESLAWEAVAERSAKWTIENACASGTSAYPAPRRPGRDDGRRRGGMDGNACIVTILSAQD